MNFQLAGLATNDTAEQQPAAANRNINRNAGEWMLAYRAKLTKVSAGAAEEADHSGILGTVANIIFSPIRMFLGTKAPHQGEKVE